MFAARTVSLPVIALTAVLSVVRIQAADTFGAGVTVTDVTPLSAVLARPAEFEGKTVRVDGTVTAVCTHMGCWMALAPDGTAAEQATPASTMMIKVDDGVIVFPVSAKGKRASAQGVVQKVGGDAEGQSAAREHAAHTGGAQAAPVTWQIKATGAVIH